MSDDMSQGGHTFACLRRSIVHTLGYVNMQIKLKGRIVRDVFVREGVHHDYD